MPANSKELHNLKTGQIIRFLQTSEDTNGTMLDMEATYPAGSPEPPVHYHPKQEELFRVISGQINIRINGLVQSYKPGSLIEIKAGDKHSMWNSGSENAVVSWQVWPALETEQFLRIMTLVANSPKSNEKGLPDPPTMLYLLNKYDRVIRLTKPPYVAVKTIGILLYPLLKIKGRKLSVKSFLLLFILALSLTFQSCKKSGKDSTDNLPEDPLHTNGKRQLLKGIQWKEFNASAAFEYNTDSTIRQINYTGPASSYEVAYTYTSKRIKEINTAGSLYKNIFEHNAAGQITSMTRHLRLGDQHRANQRLEFTYNSNNTVSVMKYYQINEAGTELIYTNTYEYNAQYLPVKITGIDKNGAKLVTTIEAFSKVASFDPLYFTATDISEDYMIYNLPVISQLKQLPALIKLIRFRNGQPYVEKQTTITYTVTDGRIEKQINALKFPEHPNLDQSSEVTYTY
ncbi:MAG TPA: cupin domain-containing protein [Pedobacter sp.]|nr:cupin domain-containing protein [Pedobacter sp.]